MKKLTKKLDSMIIAAKLKLDDLMSKEEGMETLEVVIVAFIGILIAAAVVAFIGKDKDSGLLKNIFKSINTKLKDIFGSDFEGG